MSRTQAITKQKKRPAWADPESIDKGAQKQHVRKEKNTLRGRKSTFFTDYAGILVALLVLILFLALHPATAASFNTGKNIFNVLRQISNNVLLACGMTMVIILGGIDLSVGAIIALSGVLSAGCVVRYGVPLVPAIVIGILIGLFIGILNGLIVAKTTIPPFIVTLAMMNVARGLAGVYTGGSPVRVMTEEWRWIGAGYIGHVPVPVIIMLLIMLISAYIMNRTKVGRYIYAVGGNPQAAEFSGIRVPRVKFFVYTYSGLMAGLAGVILASRMYSGQPTAGEGAELDAIAAVVIGGTSMMGGSGQLGGTFIGALIIGILSNGLNLRNVNSFWQTVVKGLVILLAVFMDYLKTVRKAKS